MRIKKSLINSLPEEAISKNPFNKGRENVLEDVNMQNRLLDELRSGLSLTQACRSIGIFKDSFYRLKRRCFYKDEKGDQYPIIDGLSGHVKYPELIEFFKDIQRARNHIFSAAQLAVLSGIQCNADPYKAGKLGLEFLRNRDSRFKTKTVTEEIKPHDKPLSEMSNDELQAAFEKLNG